MNENWKYIFKPGACPTIDELKLYSANKLGKERRFAIENHLADCEICTDLLEGFEALSAPERLNIAELELKDRVDALLGNQKKARLFFTRPWVVAASIVMLLGSASLIFLMNRNSTQNIQFSVAQKIEVEKPPETPQPKDSNMVLAERRLSGATKQKAYTIQSQSAAGASNNDRTTTVILAKEVMEANDPEEVSKFEAAASTNLPAVKSISESDNKIESTIESKMSVQSDKKSKSKKTEVYPALNSNTKLIRGKITDDAGEVLPGVNIMIKGTTQGTISDLNGNYTIEVPESEAKLIFNYIGYLTEEIPAVQNNELNVVLTSDQLALEEVVVVGYGSSRSEDVYEYKTKEQLEQEKRLAYIEKAKQLKPEIDLLNQQLKLNSNLKLRKELTQKYLECGDKVNAIDQLQILFRDIIPGETREKIIEIIQLTQDEDYPKALRKLKKIELQ